MRTERIRTVCMSLVALALVTCGWAAGASAQAERTSRDSWQRVDDIFAALEVKEGDRIADVGAGSGFFTFRLSPRVGADGRVLAEDVSRRVLEELRETAEREGFTNVETILGEADDPELPEGSLDGLLIVNAYHEMYEHEAMLAGIRRALRPGGRLVILDMPRDSVLSRRRQMGEHGLAIGIVVQDLVAAGFEVVAQDPDFVRSGRNRQWMVVAVVPEAAGVNPRYEGARL
jgi:predicted methyltransferase